MHSHTHVWTSISINPFCNFRQRAKWSFDLQKDTCLTQTRENISFKTEAPHSQPNIPGNITEISFSSWKQAFLLSLLPKFFIRHSSTRFFVTMTNDLDSGQIRTLITKGVNFRYIPLWKTLLTLSTKYYFHKHVFCNKLNIY